MGSIATADRRDPTAPRRPFHASIDLGPDKSRDAIHADAIDLSVGGMSVRSPLLPDLGEQLAFRFMLEDGRSVDGRGEVVWCHDEGSRAGAFGVKFLAMQGEARASLRRSLEPTARTGADSKVRLHLDSMDAPFRAKVRERTPGALIVGHDLSFLKLGGKVTVEGAQDNEPGVISAVDVEVDPITHNPRLILTIDMGDGPTRAQRISSVAKAPVTAALIDAAKAEGPKSEPPRIDGLALAATVEAPAKSEAPKAETVVVEAKLDAPKPAKVEAPAVSDRAIDTAPNDPPTVRTRPAPAAAPVAATPSAVDSTEDDFDDEFPAGPSWMQRGVAVARNAWEGTRRIATPVAAGVVKGVSALRARFGRSSEVDEFENASLRNGLRPQHSASSSTATTSDLDGTLTRKRNRRVVMYALAAVALTVAILALAIGGGPSSPAPHPQVAVTADPAPAADLVAPAPNGAAAMPEGTTEEPVPTTAEPRFVAAGNNAPADLRGAAASSAGQFEGAQPLVVQNRARGAGFVPAVTPNANRPLAAGVRPMLSNAPVRGAALGNPGVRVGTRLALRMDGPVVSVSGPGTRGNTIVVVIPGRRSLDLAASLARLDPRLTNAGIINRAAGAELTLRFREAAPPFFAHARGNTLEVILGATPGAPVRRAAMVGPASTRISRR